MALWPGPPAMRAPSLPIHPDPLMAMPRDEPFRTAPDPTEIKPVSLRPSIIESAMPTKVLKIPRAAAKKTNQPAVRTSVPLPAPRPPRRS